MELGDTITDRDELGRTPNETVLLDLSQTVLESLHVSLVIPRLDVKGDDGLSGCAGALCSLLLLVLCDTLSLDTCSLRVLFVGAKEVDLVVGVGVGSLKSNGLGGGGLYTGVGGSREEGCGAGLIAMEMGVLLLERGDVCEPTCDVGVFVGVGC